MAVYHCPHCQRELTRGNIPFWPRMLVGHIFGLPFRTLVCSDHGELPSDSLIPEERDRILGQRMWIGILAAAFDGTILYLILTNTIR